MNHEIHERREKIFFKNESYALQGAIFEVYKKMGVGFLEAVYQECLEKEFTLRKIPFKSQAEIRLNYKIIPLTHAYRADFICFDSIIIEIKTVSQILDVHRAHILNYLRVTHLKLGLLLNFSAFPKVEIERIVL